MDTKYITPIDYIDGIYVKREDLYKPCSFSNANGSKLRQCMLLVEKNIEIARNGIITGTSVESPQSAILATVAKSMNIPCTILYGGTTYENLAKKKYPMIAKELGANIVIGSKIGYTSVLEARAREIANKDKFFFVEYGFDLMNNLDVFIESTALQVKNIPDVDNVCVTCGSAITLIGILYGLAIFKKNVKNIYAYGIAPNRMNKLYKYKNLIFLEKGVVLPIEKVTYIDYFAEVGYNYTKSIYENLGNINLHPRYEAKTYSWLKKAALDGDTLFWIVGGDL